MTEDETFFDPLLKKKKKKKKLPFLCDLTRLEENAHNTSFEVGFSEPPDGDNAVKDESEAERVEEKDDTVLDLDDFAGLRKKKKKKKQFLLDGEAIVCGGEREKAETESKDDVNVLITDEKDETILDDELDFSLPKKKKKKKKILDFELECSEYPGAEEDEDDDTKFEDDAELKIITTVSSDTFFLGISRDYTYEELLIRVFSLMKEKNPDIIAGEKRRFIMRPPQVLRVGTKKTSFANFIEICKMVHRQPRHLQSFLLAELGTSGSVDANNQLIIKGRFMQKQIENVLRRYIREYVTCHTCRSPETILAKDTRLFFLNCETCGSRCSVASIKSGFQAVTGKRAAIRAKTT